MESNLNESAFFSMYLNVILIIFLLKIEIIITNELNL